MPQRDSYASSNRLSTATSRGRRSPDISSAESEYSDGGTNVIGQFRGHELEERRREREERREREAERQRLIQDFVRSHRNDIIESIVARFGKSVEDVASGFDALPLERRYAWATWQRRASPRRADRTIVYDGLRAVIGLLDWNSPAGNSLEGSTLRAHHSFGPPPRRYQRPSDLSVARITTAMEEVLGHLGLR